MDTFKTRAIVAATFVLLLFAQKPAAQATVFKYQGSLTDAGTPANGTFQMQFKLFDAVSGGAQIGPTLAEVPITATNGVFSASLNFGSAALNGANRWLEIAVRRNSGESYVTLSPREQISSSPYSVRTLSAATADMALDSQKLGGVNASEYVTTASGGNSFIKNADAAVQTANFNISGNGKIGGSLNVGPVPSQVARVEVINSGDAIRGISGSGGRGVWGHSESWQGVYGRSNTNAGVVGESNSQYGVFGITNGIAASGIYGSNNAAGGTGILGQSNGGKAVAGLASGAGVGVSGEVSATNAYGVRGTATAFNSVGVKGEANADQGIGVWGQSNANTGVFGLTTNGFGVYARSTGTGRAIFAEGNAGQSLDKGGFVKAMAYVNADGSFRYCYNGITGASTGNCGFSFRRLPSSVGRSIVNFNFQASDRFISAIPIHTLGSVVAKIVPWDGVYQTATEVFVITTTLDGSGVDSAFYIIVY